MGKLAAHHHWGSPNENRNLNPFFSEFQGVGVWSVGVHCKHLSGPVNPCFNPAAVFGLGIVLNRGPDLVTNLLVKLLPSCLLIRTAVVLPSLALQFSSQRCLENNKSF